MFERIAGGDLLGEIFAQIRENIRAGRLKKGDRLPTERAMAAALGVSRTTLREALKALELMGLVECVQGGGNYIAANLSHSFAGPLSVMFLLEEGTLAQVQQFRRAMEVAAAQGAAAVITTGQAEELAGICDQIEAGGSQDTLAHLDRAFHQAIASISGNPLVVTMMNATEALVEDQIRDARARMLGREDALEAINRQHRALVVSLARRDEAGAVAAITAHMDFVGTFYASLPDQPSKG